MASPLAQPTLAAQIQTAMAEAETAMEAMAMAGAETETAGAETETAEAEMETAAAETETAEAETEAEATAVATEAAQVEAYKSCLSKHDRRRTRNRRSTHSPQTQYKAACHGTYTRALPDSKMPTRRQCQSSTPDQKHTPSRHTPSLRSGRRHYREPRLRPPHQLTEAVLDEGE